VRFIIRGGGRFVTHRFLEKIKICQDNAFHLNSNRKILYNLIGCISLHAYFLFLSPRLISLFEKI
jgi:hypothetical protein